MSPATAEENKEIYRTFHDQIIAKRFESPFPIRRHAHRMQYQAFIDLIPSDSTVLDAGCGEGILSVMLAKNGCTVTGVDLSEPNIEAAKKLALQEGVEDKCIFLVGDAEHLPVPDKSFEYAVSSHVLEHLPDFTQGVRELKRVAKTKVIAAIPTCLNLCSFVQCGWDKYWVLSRRSLYALPLGFLRTLIAFVTFQEGVNEGYAGHPELIHIFRFPWVGKRKLQRGGLKVTGYRASSLIIPYFSIFLPITKAFEHMIDWPFIRNFGYGTTYVCEVD